MNRRDLLIAATLCACAAPSQSQPDSAAEQETGFDAFVDTVPIDSTIDPDELIPAIGDLPGNPAGPAPPRGAWRALGGPVLPHEYPAGRAESAGTTITGYSFLFRSVGGKVAEPFADSSDVLRLGPRDKDGLFFDPPFVSAAGGFILATERGLFRAAPSATTWTRVPCPPASALASSPCGQAIQTASGAIVLRRIFPTATELFRTADDGVTWTKVATLPYYGCSAAGSVGLRVFAQCQDVVDIPDGGPADAYVSRNPLFMSSDDGKSFVETTSMGSTGYAHALTDRGILALTSDAIKLSKDWGATWTTVYTTKTANLLTDYPFPARGSRAFVGGRVKPAGDFFLLRSRDGGETWTQLTTPPPIHMYTFRLAIGDGARVEAHGQSSDDDGETWKPSFSVPVVGLRIFVQRKGTASSGDLWLASRELFKSTDGGATWRSVLASPTSSAMSDDATGAVLRAEYDAIYRTMDGSSWTKVLAIGGATLHAGGGVIVTRGTGTSSTINVSSDGGLTWKLKSTPASYVSFFTVSAKGAIYLLGSGTLAISADHGETWKVRKIPTSIGSQIDVAQSGEIFVWHRDAIFRSSDDGVSWFRQASAGLPSSRREVLTWAARAPLGMFFARGFVPQPDGSDEPHLYVSLDGGASFHRYDDGLPPRHVMTAAFDTTGRLFAGTLAGTYRFENAE
jgi:hypothetical protein